MYAAGFADFAKAVVALKAALDLMAFVLFLMAGKPGMAWMFAGMAIADVAVLYQ